MGSALIFTHADNSFLRVFFLLRKHDSVFISKMCLGLIQSGQRKVAADSPFQRAGLHVSSCSASTECNRQKPKANKNADYQHTLSPAAAAFCCF